MVCSLRKNLGTSKKNGEGPDRCTGGGGAAGMAHRKEYHRCSQKHSWAVRWRQDRSSSSVCQSSFWSPHSACGRKTSRWTEQRHSSAMGTSAYSDDLVLPERPAQCQPPNEVTSSQSPTLNAHINRPRGLRWHNRTSHSLLIFKGWELWEHDDNWSSSCSTLMHVDEFGLILTL